MITFDMYVHNIIVFYKSDVLKESMITTMKAMYMFLFYYLPILLVSMILGSYSSAIQVPLST